jgi:hypothetical protein
MKKNHLYKNKWLVIAIAFSLIVEAATAQTDIDGIMMGKKDLCIGPMFGHSSWKNYWEGTFKRNNANLGTVSSSTYSIMGNYGISDKLNVLFGLPYIASKATAGQLQKMQGLQDVSLWVKYMPVEKEWGSGIFSLYTIAGLSFPSANYVADFLPLSIGLHSTNASLRLMADYQVSSWFCTLSGTYIARSNVKIDRTSYYTTEVHYSNEVKMPDAAQVNFRTGLRNDKFVAEAVVNNWVTQGGFDITKNNMPFLSNRMNMTTVGFNGKYNVPRVTGLSLTGGANYVVAGRNAGQSTNYNMGIFYIIGIAKNKVSKKEAKTATPEK